MNLTQRARQMLQDTQHYIHQEARGWVAVGGPEGPFAASTGAIEAATDRAIAENNMTDRYRVFRAVLLEYGIRGEFADGAADLTPIGG